MRNMYDAVVVGGGPAGLSAAIYLGRAKHRVLVVEKVKIGGQITITSDVANYPGITQISGTELTDEMYAQAKKFGAEFVEAGVRELTLDQQIKRIDTTKGSYQSLSVILATGANPRKIGFIGEEKFQGHGVSYCATCDGEFFSGMDVFVIGGGFAAVEESIFLTKYAKSVTILVRKNRFSCAGAIVDELKKYPKITVKFNTELVRADGQQTISYAEFKNNKTGEMWRHDAVGHGDFGIFVFAGYIPNTALFADTIHLNQQGYVITDANQKTNLDGVYAAGDVCIKNLRQIVTAVSDGAIAATALDTYISAMHEKFNLSEVSQIEEVEDKSKKQDEDNVVQKEGDDMNFISADIREKLEPILTKFEHKVILKVWLNDSEFSMELKNFAKEFCSLTANILYEEGIIEGAPGLEIIREDETSSGIIFHSVPGGHEFNSFVLALYNVAGPGQDLDPAVEKKLEHIQKPIHIQVVVSLSCTMCPEVVIGTQRLAAASSKITAEMYDAQHFPDLRKKYNIMSVPCMIVNDTAVYFGKKNISEIIDLLL
ncbi:FAD-dependent oxidoreductase [Megasphaera sueciensis]|uniref:FAD-dependent oxidoreductase n=1 Tax=Megasphaera sueciensis TaxID=349094 RepID=UPI003D09513C